MTSAAKWSMMFHDTVHPASWNQPVCLLVVWDCGKYYWDAALQFQCISVQKVVVLNSACQTFYLSKIPCLEWKLLQRYSHCCLLYPAKSEAVVFHYLLCFPYTLEGQLLFSLFFFLPWCEIKLQNFFFPPVSLNRVPRLSFQPVFSLGSLPGKQQKHLNQWKMCLMLSGSRSIKHYNHIIWRPPEWTIMKCEVNMGLMSRTRDW